MLSTICASGELFPADRDSVPTTASTQRRKGWRARILGNLEAMADQERRGSAVDCNSREMLVCLSPFPFFSAPTDLSWFTFPILYELQPMVVIYINQAMWYQKAQGRHCY